MKNEKGTIVLAGGVIGLIAAILVFFGNPANMGFCIACFLRDTTGALGLIQRQQFSISARRSLVWCLEHVSFHLLRKSFVQEAALHL